MKVPFIDLVGEYKSMKTEMDKAVISVLESGKYILGKNVRGLEQKIASFLNCRYAVGVASGTDALKVALAAINIQPGDEVITTAFTYIATAEAIVKSKAKPVFADIDPQTCNLSAESIKKAITPKTKAIIPVHLYGHPAEMDSILKIAEKNSLAVIEDAAQAFGAVYHGRAVGNLGLIGCFSFFPTKNLSAYGDGGMVTTNNKKLYELMLKLRVHGASSKYEHIIDGYNSRLDELQAAVLNVKMRRIKKWLRSRIDAAGYYNQLFSRRGLAEIIPPASRGSEPSYCLYTLKVSNRDKLLNFLISKKIDAAVYYPLPLHLQKVYKSLGYGRGDLPAAEKAAGRVLSIPIYPGISKEQQEYVADSVAKFFDISS